ncbi:MAG: hypothetical protein ACIAXF_12515 [Phycisphaerales bacterium JB063]
MDSSYQTPMIVGRARPTTLSDPFHDHRLLDVSAFLAKPEVAWDWGDYQTVLGPYLPAGTYSESVYFLPGAFEYIYTHEDDALDLVSPIIGFVSIYARELEKDGLLESCRSRIRELLEHWVSSFRVVHFDKAACKKNGGIHDYFDYVKQSEVVCEATSDLVKFDVHADLAVDFYQDLARFGLSPFKAAWLLELSRAQATHVYHPPIHPEIGSALNAPESLLNAYRAVQKTLATTESSPTYWRDLIARFDYLE